MIHSPFVRLHLTFPLPVYLVQQDFWTQQVPPNCVLVSKFVAYYQLCVDSHVAMAEASEERFRDSTMV